MQLEYYSPQILTSQIKQILGKYFDLSKIKVFYFGSRVTGSSNKRSDIDIGLQNPEKISSKIKFELLEDLDNLPVLYKIDLVDFSQTSSSFQKEALKKIEMIL